MKKAVAKKTELLQKELETQTGMKKEIEVFLHYKLHSYFNIYVKLNYSYILISFYVRSRTNDMKLLSNASTVNLAELRPSTGTAVIYTLTSVVTLSSILVRPKTE